MSEQKDESIHKRVGKQMNSDVVNQNQGLFIPHSTVLRREQTDTLNLHEGLLPDKDVQKPDHSSPAHRPGQLVDQMVSLVSKIFQDIRYSKKILLADIRREIVPMVMETAEHPDLFDLFSVLQAKDDYLYRHPIGVGVIATLIGKWLQLHESNLLQLATAAVLHDIGKMRIPPEILNKPGKLTEDEFHIMKKHTILGYEMLKETIGTNHRQALVALQHHERMDGSGYPFGIREEKIDLFSRIVSVADVFHAMTSKRVYRDSSPFFEILNQMEQNAFGALDPTIVRLFISKIMQSLVGSGVTLTDGRTGKIVMLNPYNPTRPLIQVEEGFLDLSRDLSIQIRQVLVL